ncbi:winged helix-turn-helix transcriptional regulator [Aurantiacibacter gilvus]|uniref:Helix-turn-helix domain-containing protein n=1 Tax=Aurantiacibacter gilvus TaxID=3139141 RepID=A0ABU9IBH9_9SPHN
MASQHGKWYGDACGTAFGLEILGERWAMLIVRELLLGPRRFSDLREALPGISAKVLTERLENLAGWGVLTRHKLAPPASGKVYELTEWGYAAEPAIMELGRWAALSAKHDPQLPLSAVSLMTSMKTMQLPVLADAPDMRIGMQVGAEEFVVSISAGQFAAERGAVEDCQAVLRAPAAPPIAGALYADIPLEALEADAGLKVEGDRALVVRFLGLFGLPPKLDAA